MFGSGVSCPGVSDRVRLGGKEEVCSRPCVDRGPVGSTIVRQERLGGRGSGLDLPCQSPRDSLTLTYVATEFLTV